MKMLSLSIAFPYLNRMQVLDAEFQLQEFERLFLCTSFAFPFFFYGFVNCWADGWFVRRAGFLSVYVGFHFVELTMALGVIA